MEFNLCMQKYQSLYKLALLFLMEVAIHVQSTQNRKLLIFFHYLKKILMKFIFCMQINMEVLYKLILTFWVCLIRPSQSAHNSSVCLGVIWQKSSHFELGKVLISWSKSDKRVDYFSEFFFELKELNIVCMLFLLKCFTYVKGLTVMSALFL